MWSQLKNNSLLAFIAVLLIAGSNSYVAYESSRTNINMEHTNNNMELLTKTMLEVSERSTDNSKLIVDNQRDMLALQERMFNKDWEQDKIITEIYRQISLDRKRE